MDPVLAGVLEESASAMDQELASVLEKSKQEMLRARQTRRQVRDVVVEKLRARSLTEVRAPNLLSTSGAQHPLGRDRGQGRLPIPRFASHSATHDNRHDGASC
jgi:hypothetical protein